MTQQFNLAGRVITVEGDPVVAIIASRKDWAERAFSPDFGTWSKRPNGRRLLKDTGDVLWELSNFPQNLHRFILLTAEAYETFCAKRAEVEAWLAKRRPIDDKHAYIRMLSDLRATYPEFDHQAYLTEAGVKAITQLPGVSLYQRPRSEELTADMGWTTKIA